MSRHHRYEVLAIEDHRGIRCVDCWEEEPGGLDTISHVHTPAGTTTSRGMFCDRCGNCISGLHTISGGKRHDQDRTTGSRFVGRAGGT